MTRAKEKKFIYFMRAHLIYLILIGFILSLNACATSNEQIEDSEIILERTTFSFDQNKHPFDLFPEYLLVPGDVLDVLFQIRTWIEKEEFKFAVDHAINVKFVHNAELNQRQIVRPDGTISLPYLKEVHVTGKTVAELTDELEERYSKILKNPEIYVVVPEFRSAIKELKADLHTAPRGLSRLVTVRPDGHVTFPMVGNIFVANKTIPEVNKILNNLYEKVLPDLHVDLFLEKHAGSVVYVLGEVKKPGAYKIVKPITLVEALTLAESYLPGAKLSSVIVARKQGKTIVATRVDLKSTLALDSESKFFYLQPDDIVYVPKRWITKAAEVARDIADIMFFRGWGVNFSWELYDEGPAGQQ